MDNLASRLRVDAEQIECTVSTELDDRIRASLQSVAPATRQLQNVKRESKSFSSWWAGSLTGVAAAILLIVFVNVRAPDSVPDLADAPPQPLTIPTVSWHAQTAVLTLPLEQEMQDLQSDLKKAEEIVKQDIDRLF